MREFKSLKPRGLAEGFDATKDGAEPVISIKEAKSLIEIAYAFPGFFLSDDEQPVKGKNELFRQVNIPATGVLGVSGKPALPSFSRYVQIPADCTYSWSVTMGDPVEFEGIRVMPAQEKIVDSADVKHELEFDSDAYKRDEWYPQSMVEVSGPYDIDEYKSVLVHVTPFQYNPSRGKLVGYGNITLTLMLEGMRGTDSDHPFPDTTVEREAFGNLFLNPRRGVAERVELQPERIVIPPLHLQGAELLIIHDDVFRAAADRLAAWKRLRGMIVETIPISSIGNQSGTIKTYIRNRRRLSLRTRYIMLLGDTQSIATESVHGNSTDYYYTTPRDAATADELVYPWLSLGRLPLTQPADALSQVDELIKYEKDPPTDSGYYRTIVLAAYFQDDNGDGREDRAYVKTMEEIRTYLVTLGFNVVRVYVTNSPVPRLYNDGTPLAPDVIGAFVPDAAASQMLVNAAGAGQLIMAHRDHGSTNGWHKPAFGSTQIAAVSGTGQSLFYSVNCLTGSFQLSPPRTCFAENLLLKPWVTPSLIGATDLSHTFLNDALMKGLFDGMWGGMNATFPSGTASYAVRHNRLGDLLNYARAYLPLSSAGNTASIVDHWEIYHVLGDPSLEIWQSEPMRMRLSATVIGRELTILLNPCPRDAVVTVWLGQKLLKRIAPATPRMHLSLQALTPPPAIPLRPEIALTVACWAPGYRFATARPVLLQVAEHPVLPAELPI